MKSYDIHRYSVNLRLDLMQIVDPITTMRTGTSGISKQVLSRISSPIKVSLRSVNELMFPDKPEQCSHSGTVPLAKGRLKHINTRQAHIEDCRRCVLGSGLKTWAPPTVAGNATTPGPSRLSRPD